MNRSIIVLLILLCGSDILMHDRIPIDKSPRIKSDYGHLKFITVRRKNIYFRALENGDIYFNDVTLKQYWNQVKQLNNTVRLLELKLKPQCNCKLFEHKIKLNFDQINNLKTLLDTANNKIKVMETKVNQVQTLINTNNCAPNTCHNGGRCINGFNSYVCLCPDNFQGMNCELDVNECLQNAGTDLACQNNAVCENLQGSYRCKCTGKWTGVHCSVPKNRCSGSSNAELCGHGICIPDSSSTSSISHRCICDNGWKLDSVTNTCTVDVDECNSVNNRYPCSTHPHVQCVNTPGSFHCGSCPSGFLGNGYKCVDINECEGGRNPCAPGERCRNKFGSHKCLCPRGMRRDNQGVCKIRNICNTNNGGCHIKARCIRDDNNVNGRQCVCQSGYRGSGVGSRGCRKNRRQSAYDRCVRRRYCGHHGTCVKTRSYFRCRCSPSFTGRRCKRLKAGVTNPCTAGQNPCLNGGSCQFKSPNSYTCTCTSRYSGQNCQVQNSQCGGNIFHPQQRTVIELIRNGDDKTSVRNYAYPCTWFITTDQNKFIELTITYISLSGSCTKEYLNITERSLYRNRGNGDPLVSFCPGNVTKSVNSSEPIVVVRAGLVNSFSEKHGFRMSIKTHNMIVDENNCCRCLKNMNTETHSLRGMFQSPSYPFNYPRNWRCTLLFDRGPNYRSRIELFFQTLDLGQRNSRNCFRSDRLIMSFKQKVIRITPCNQNKYRNRRFILPVVRIVFVSARYQRGSNKSSPNKRFRITWRKARFTEKCGGAINGLKVRQFVVPAMTKDDDIYCTWRLDFSNLTGLVNLNFTLTPYTQTSFCRPKIYISSNSMKRMALLCPSRERTKTLNLPVKSPINMVYSKSKGYSVPSLKVDFNLKCGQFINMDVNSQVYIKSPNFPNNYPANENCLFTIYSKTKFISWKFLQLDIPDGAMCTNDFVKMQYLSTDDLGQIRHISKKVCNDNFNPDMIYSQREVSSSIKIQFTSNSSINGFGFKMVITSSKCEFAISLYDQAVYNFSYPFSFLATRRPTYSFNKRCSWTILAPRNYFIRLDFLQFNLEFSGSCTFDYLKISEFRGIGNRTATTNVKKYCGTKIQQMKIYETNKLNLFFKSDFSIHREGFVVKISRVHKAVCHFEYTQSQSVIMARPDCQYVIHAPSKQRIEMNIDINNRHLPNEEIAVNCNCPYNEDKLVFVSNHKPVCQSCPFRKNFISNYNTITFKYVTSMAQTSPTSFNVTYKFVISSDCGAILNQQSGVIESQNYPLYIPFRYYTCTWQINQPYGHTTNFKITNFIYKNRYCKNKSPVLKIYTTKFQKFIYCEDDVKNMTDAVFKQSPIMVKFTPLSRQALFSMEFRRSCLFVVLKKASGRIASGIQDSNGCSWIIMGMRGNNVRLEIDEFDLPMPVSGVCKTYLKISGPKGVILDASCGNNLSNRTFVSSDIPILVNYTIADEHRYMITQHKGITFEYKVEGCIFDYHFVPPSFGDQFGVLKSPNYPALVTDTDCLWKFTTVPSYSVKIIIDNLRNYDDVHTAKCTENISVLTGYEEDEAVMNICNGVSKDGIALTLQSSTHEFLLRFQGGVKGRSFKARFEMVKGSCEKQIYADSGVIKSANYPHRYRPNQRCSWKIQVPEHHSVHLKFSDILMENYCAHDNVRMFSYRKGAPVQIAKVCRMSQVRNKTFASIGNKMLVKFKSDSTTEKRGFSAEFYKSCGSLIYVSDDRSTTVKSPNYPNRYKLKDGFCEWRFVTNISDPSSQIFFYFNGFEHLTPQIVRQNYECAINATSDAEIPDNSLTIINGMTDSPNGIKRICNQNGMNIPIISNGQFMRLKLKSTTGSLIFSATVSSGSQGCGGNLYHNQGLLTSPFYPIYGIRYFDCVWKITGAPGSNVKLDIKDFSRLGQTYSYFDHLEIREGGDYFESSRKLGRFYSKYKLQKFVKNKKFSNLLWIRCHSQGEQGTNKFRFMIGYTLEYPSILTASAGEFGSPLFGHLYPYDTNKQWIISDSSNVTAADRAWKTRVSFVFFSVGRSFQNPTKTTCRDGYLEITGSDGISDKWCGNTLPPEKFYKRPIRIVLNAQNHRYPGFHLKWAQQGNTTHTKLGKCKYTLLVTNQFQVLQSPGYPIQDPKNRKCEWTIVTNKPGQLIEIKMLNFSMEFQKRCKFEYLDIDWRSNHPTINFPYHRRFCGSKLSQFDRFKRMPLTWMKLTYNVDKYDIYPGFRLMYRERCYSMFYNKREGLIKSPSDLGLPYNCKYIIPYYPLNYTFRVLKLDLPPMSNDNKCGQTSLWISFSSRNYTLCGNTIPIELRNKTILRNDFPVIIKYQGNLPRNTPYKGYKIHFYSRVDTGCGFERTLTDSSETVQLEQTGTSPKNLLCRWKIRSPLGTRMMIDAKYLNFKYCDDETNLSLFNGLTTLSPMINGIYLCRPRGSIFTSGNNLLVVFRRHLKLSKFKLSIKIASCGGERLVNNHDTISSPSVIGQYNNELCKWIIKGHFKFMKTFEIKVTTAKLRCYNEEFSILYEDIFGNTTTLPISCNIGTRVKSMKIHAKDIIISFRRKRATSFGSFMFTYNATERMCGGWYTSPSNVISSVPAAFSCKWHVKVAPTKSITLNIINMKHGCLLVGHMMAPLNRYCTPGVTINTNRSELILYFMNDKTMLGSITFNYTSNLPSTCGYEIKASSVNTTGKIFVRNQTFCDIKFNNNDNGVGTIIFIVLKPTSWCNNVKILHKTTIGSGQIISFPTNQCFNKVPYIGGVSSIHSMIYSPTGDLNFDLRYEFENCGGYIDSSRPVGYIKSLNYPNYYPRNLKCDWIIEADKTQYVKLTIIDLHLEHHSICRYDKLAIKIGWSERNPVVKEFCGRHNHTNETMTINSNEVRLRFKSDGSRQDIGFLILYEFVSAVDSCHGISFRLSGTIKSPNYPRPHPRSLNCNWTLILPPSFQVKLVFDPFFDLEPSKLCVYDSLVIIDSDFSEKKRLCGHVAPTKPIISLTNRMSLIFKTDYNLNLDGFKVEYTAVCGGIYNNTKGTINSPTYIYGANRCNFYIKKWSGYMTTMVVRLLKNLCSRSKKGVEVLVQLKSGRYIKKRNLCKKGEVKFVVTKSVKIRYKTVLYSSRKDFVIFYRHESNFKSMYNITKPQTIATPSPLYHHNANLTWIYTTLPKYIFYLNFEFADIETHSRCKFDYLLIYRSINSSEPNALIERICGNMKKLMLKIDSNVIMMNFISDRSHVTKHKGFKALLIPTPGEKLGCGGDFLLNTSSSGIIKSLDLNNDGLYDDRLRCIWTMNAPYGYAIELRFQNNSVEIEKSRLRGCVYDILDIMDGSSPYSPLLEKLCGKVAVDPFNTTGNSLRISFITDKSIRKKGFMINYRVVPSNNHIIRIATPTFETIRSFNYPATINFNQRILMEITTPNDTDHLELKIEELSIRNSPDHTCYPDKLTISDTSIKYSGYRQYCSSSTYLISYISSGQSVSIRFDVGPETTFHNPIRFIIKYRIYNCNREEIGYNGLISNINSYRYKHYSHNTDCLLNLMTPVPGLYFQFYFYSFSIEANPVCLFDYLQFTEQYSNRNRTLSKLCGTSIPPSIISNSSSVWIRFVTDGSVKKLGYKFIYVVSKDINNPYCGGNITTSTGALTSPGFGTNKFNPGRCLWRIQLPKLTNILVTITHLEMPTNNNSTQSTRMLSYCSSTTNYVRISYERNVRKLCTQRTPITKQDQLRDEIKVYYYSETGGVGAGFRMTWKKI